MKSERPPEEAIRLTTYADLDRYVRGFADGAFNLLVLVGAPAVGGLLAGEFGSGVPVAIDAATFVAVTVAAALVRTRRVPQRLPAAEGSTQAPANVNK